MNDSGASTEVRHPSPKSSKPLDPSSKFPAGLISGWLRRTQEGGRMERGTRQRLATFAKFVEAGEI